MDNSIYLNNDNHAFSYNTSIIMTIGGRGVGKTYMAKHYVTKNFLRKGIKFIWLRDTAEAVKELTDHEGLRFFEDYLKDFGEDMTGKIKGDSIYINNNFAGYILPVSTYYKYKGSAYSAYNRIVFDEFIPEDVQAIRGSRLEQFLNTMETIGRLRNDFKLIMLANALDINNELLDLFNFKINGFGYYVDRQKSCVLHYMENKVSFNKARENSIVGKLLKGTIYEDNIAFNKFRTNDIKYFNKLPPNARLYCCVCNKSKKVKLYFNNGNVYCVLAHIIDRANCPHYVKDIFDVDNIMKLAPQGVRDNLMLSFLDNKVFFNAPMSRSIILDFLS